MSKSVGQWIGSIVGTVIGAFVGYPMLGMAIGGLIGGVIDPPKGPSVTGPRLSDLSVQTASYGMPIPRVHGTVALHGNIIWVENNQLKEVESKEEQGGKGGGGGAEVTSYKYYATFAVGLCLGPIAGVRRIWMGSKLIFDAGDSSIDARIMSMEQMAGWAVNSVTAPKTIVDSVVGENFSVYLGTDTQEPDARMQATLGIANTPAYRGLAYIVFKDWPLKDYGNSLLGCQVKVEIVSDGTAGGPSLLWNRGTYGTLGTAGLWNPAINSDSSWVVGGTTTHTPIGWTGGIGGSTYGPYGMTVEEGLITCYRSFWLSSTNTEYRWKFQIDYNGNLVYKGYTVISNSDSALLSSCYGYIGMLGNAPVRFIATGGLGDSAYGYIVIPGGPTLYKSGSSVDEVIGAACEPYGNRLFILGIVNSVRSISIYNRDGQLESVQPTTILDGFAVGNIYLPCIQGTPYVFSAEYDYLWYSSSYEGSISYWKVNSDGTLTHEHDFSASWWGVGAYHSFVAKDGIGYMVDNNGGCAMFQRMGPLTASTPTLAEVVEKECLLSGILTVADLNTADLTDTIRGYTVANSSSIRSALEPLQAAWPFDVIQNGYQIKFIRRGKTSIATISEAELGAVAFGDTPAIKITHSREMDTQLPRKITVKYLDPIREYDIGAGIGAERLNTDAVNEVQIDLPVVLVAEEAARVEEVLLYMNWLERHDISFVLPPTYQNLEPADVVTINTSNLTYNLRLTSINYLPDGRLECTAKFNNAAIYVSTAVGETPLSLGQTLVYPGGSFCQLIDIPCVDSSIMNTAGFIGAVTGYSDGWPGSYLFKTEDNGQTWEVVQGFQNPGDSMGSATNTISSGPTHIMDMSNTLNVRMYSGTLSSVTEITLLNGSNHFAYGAADRWEIIAAQYCTLETDGTYTLSGLLRGRFGTEQYMSTHSANDAIIMLNKQRIQFIAASISSINMSKTYRNVTRGKNIDTTSDILFTYKGVNLECLPPCDIIGYINTTNDWVISWTPRSRTPVEPFSGLATPLGETTQSYELEIWNETFTVLKRTITGLSTPTTTYTSAMQVTDFSANKHVIGVKVYQLSAIMGRGYAGTILLDKFNNNDMYWKDVSLYLRLGTDSQYIDFKGNTVATTGLTFPTSDPWGTSLGSLYSSGGSGIYLGINSATPVNFGYADFTIDFWINLDVNPTPGTYPWIFSTGAVNSLQGLYCVATGPSTSWGGIATIGVYMTSQITNGAVNVSTSIIRSAGWKYIEYNRKGTQTRLFVNGILESLYTTDTVKNLPGGFVSLFSSSATGALSSTDKANIRDFRITKNVARHLTNYIPPTLPSPIS